MRFITLLIAFCFTVTAAYAYGVNTMGFKFAYYGTTTPFVFPLLSDISGLSVECDYDATSTDSHTGSGTTWSDIEGTCSDLTYSGAITFTGTPGDRAAYLDVDANQFFYSGSDETSAASNPSFASCLYTPSANQQCWVAIAFRVGEDPKSGGGPFFGVQGTGNKFGMRIGGSAGLFVEYASTAESEIEPDFAVLTRRDVVYIFNFDHSTGKLYMYQNNDEPYEISYTATSGAPTSPRALHFFSDDVLHNLNNNKRVYAISGGSGLLDRTKARGIISTYNTRHNRTYAPTNDCSNISDCVDGVLFEVHASDYTSGSTWANQATPADGASQTDYDFTIYGLTHNASPAYFSTDGNDTARLDITATQEGLYKMMDWDDADGRHIWCAIAVKTASTVSLDQSFFGNTYCPDADSPSVCGETGTGLRLKDNTGVSRMEILADYLTVREHHSDALTLSASKNMVLGFRSAPHLGDGAAQTITQGHYNNTDVIAGTVNDFTNSGSPSAKDQATGDWTIGARYDDDTSTPFEYMDSGSLIYGHVCGVNLDTKASMNKVMRTFETKNNIDFDGNGIIGVVNGVVFDGQQYLAGIQTSSGSATFEDPADNMVAGIELRMETFGWINIRSFAAVKSDGTNLAPALTRVAYTTSNDFTSISAGQYTTDSDYDQTDVNDWDNIVAHWNDASAATMSFFMEFSSEVDVTDLYIAYCQQAGTIHTVGLYDEAGTAITVGASGTADATIDGVTSVCNESNRKKLSSLSF